MKKLILASVLIVVALSGSTVSAQSFSFDAVGRLTHAVWPDGTTRVYTYDERSNVVAIDTFAVPPPLPYCTAKVNSQGCLPAAGSSGSTSFTGPGLTVTASNVLNNKVGLLFWGTTSSATPFQGGIKCVAAPTVRTPLQNSGGNPPPDDCSGAYAFLFDNAYMAAKGIGIGTTVRCQFWSRDPSTASTTGLTDGLEFTVTP